MITYVPWKASLPTSGGSDDKDHKEDVQFDITGSSSRVSGLYMDDKAYIDIWRYRVFVVTHSQ